eukprot:COSAG04_NODE_8906_length_918_cov_1.440781_1_plen_166_part_10
MIDAAWSTSSLSFPPLRAPNGSLITPVRPGADRSAIVQKMDPELLIVHFRNASADGQPHAGRCKSSEVVQAQDCITYDTVLWILSTNLSTTRGGAPTRQVHITLRDDVWTTHPIEPDRFQGFSTDCNLNRVGPVLPLRLPGGAVQAVSYSLGLPPAAQQAARRHNA